MRIQISALVTVAILFASQGCSIRVPQVEVAFSQLKKMASPGEKVRQAVWLASFNGRGAVLIPYVTDGYTIFANESGDAVAFDGWVVRSVLGFGRKASLSVSDDGWTRTSVSNMSGFTGTCSEWRKQVLTEGYEWRQICGIHGHETVIHIDGTGSVIAIRQAFGGDLGLLTLDLRR